MKKLQIPAQIKIGTFAVSSTGSLINWAGRQGEFNEAKIYFQLRFRPDHIQSLLDMGIKINFDTAKMADLSEKAKRYKAGREAIKQGRYAPYYYMGDPNNAQTGVIENWLIADASCEPCALEHLNRFCRDNHRNEIAIHNDTFLKENGWKFKTKYPSYVDIETQYKDIKAMRRTAGGKPAAKLLPIQKRVLNYINH